MKVLFAVSSESISEAIIKRYQKEYKEILSYKNVYYFNAILKEIQKDKTYDRIVISEDLEPFSNNNYDTIDKFIFEKLDSISDEAHDSQGKETSIILICTDRRVKGNSILVKLFGIGVYNALLGNDRSMEEVCKLINRPRTKKEAKMYYRIDSEDVDYKAEKENEVSEVEIQNILAHFKKLNKNTAKYVESFNNIAVQYTDEQLRIIVNCLPINVKAVLEANCERYQQLMAVTGGIPSVKGAVEVTVEGAIKNEIQEKNIGHAGQITKPIVIPSAVRNSKQGAMARTRKPVVNDAETGTRPAAQPAAQPAQNVQQANTVQRPTAGATGTAGATRPVARPATVQSPAQTARPVQGRVAQNTAQAAAAPQRPTVQAATTRNVVNPNVQRPVANQVQQNNNINLDSLEEDQVLPGMEEDVNTVDDAAERRGRGRPRKTPVVGAEVKPKGKRGRPRKIGPEEEQELEETDDVMLPGMEEDEIALPGLDDLGVEDTVQDDSMLPGMEEVEEYEEVAEDDGMLPGMEEVGEYEEVAEDDGMLPGMEEVGEYEEVVEDDGMLPGMDDTEEYEEVAEDDGMLPGMDDTEEYEEVVEDDGEYTDEVALPGLDDLDDIDDNGEVVEDDGLLPGMDDVEEYEEVEDDGLLPGMGEAEEYEEVAEDDGLLPGMGDTEQYEEEEETLLPGMGFEDDAEDMISGVNQNQQQNYAAAAPQSNYNSNSLDSIKPKIDYSMSSLNSLITKDKKIVAFIGTSKNGVSFLVENLGAYFSSMGVNTAILDMTQNKNSYYIYTKNEEELRNIAYNSIEKLQNGYAEGIKVDRNLTVYTALPNDGKDYSNAEPILSTLIQNHSLVLLDCDYDTDLTYFASCQEMYLVQSMDILTIQPLTAFLRELKTNGILEPEKIRVVINKELKVKGLSIKAIIGGLSYYNDPAMSFMTELFNKDMVKACSIPFDETAYANYLEGIVNCNISIGGFAKAKQFVSKLKVLADMVYPLTSGSKQSYSRPQTDYSQNAFSNSMNDTLNKMKKKY